MRNESFAETAARRQRESQQQGNFLVDMFSGIGRGLGYLPDPNYAPQRRRNAPKQEGTTFTSSDGTKYSTLPDGRTVYTSIHGQNYDRNSGQQVMDHKGTTGGTSTYVSKGPFSVDGNKVTTYPSGSPSSASPAPSRQEPARTSGPAPSSTKTNANGVTQTGRNLSAINMPTLSEFERYAGGTIANFAGPSFPTQADTNRISDNYNKATPVTANQALAVGAAFGGGDSKTAEAIQQGFALGGGDGDAIINTNKPGGKFSGAPTPTEGQQDPNAVDQPTGGNESRTVSTELLQGVDAGIAADGGTPPNRAGATLSKQLADRANMRFAAPTEQGEGAKYAPPTAASGEEMRRRAAFLNADNSLDGLRAVERGMGMVYAGGRHYANVNGEMKGIDSADARAIKNAAPGEAQALKDKWVAALSESKTETPQSASEAQNPTESGGSATFKAGEPTFDADKTKATSGIAEKLNGVPHSRDFTANNTESEKPLFGNAPNITGNKPGNYDLAKKFYLK